MKNLTLALSLTLALTLTPAQAQAETYTMHDVCTVLSEIAGKVMSIRQQGFERHEIIATLPVNEYGRPNRDIVIIVNKAFELYRLYDNEDRKEWAVKSHTQGTYNSCIRGGL